MEFITLTWIDYTMFVLIFSISVGVGVYFGCFGKKQKSTTDYLLGGRSMKIFPVSMSLVASSLSGVSLMGIPAEIYMHGTQYSVMVFALILTCLGNIFIYLPVFYKLQLTNSFEYLEMRFDFKLKTIASILYTFTMLLYLPVIIYAPSLAFTQVTGCNLYVIALIMSIICVFYTSIGGLKAIIWTDTLQLSVTLCTLACVFIMGTISVGGFSNIWNKALDSNRIEFFNMNPDPTIRNTFWTVLVGNFFLWSFHVSVGPPSVQRFLSVPTLSDAKKALGIFLIFTAATKIICMFAGLIIYAKYFDCDPLTAGYMQKADQIVPFYVLEVAEHLPGLSGLFVAGLFSTALSALSTYLNTISGIIYTDFITPFLDSSKTKKHGNTIMKIITVILGCVSMGSIFILEKLGSILELVVSFVGVSAGPILGLVTLGMLFPFANTKGALVGVCGSLCLMGLITVKSQIYIWNGEIKHFSKPLYTYGCNVTDSIISNTASSGTSEEIYWLYRISFHYYFLIGSMVTVIIGLIVSLITRNSKDPVVNPELLSPFVRRFLKRSVSQNKFSDKELNLMNNINNIDKYNVQPENDTLLKSSK